MATTPNLKVNGCGGFISGTREAAGYARDVTDQPTGLDFRPSAVCPDN